ncbi:MAG: TerB family tellurite resistance protein [Aquabacterium sp.]|nr:TerB family tellurite resistance protein [Aquabacterium sp.]
MRSALPSRSGPVGRHPRCSLQTDLPQERSIVRSYPQNSPEAAARIVSLVLISDGHVCRSEFDILKQLSAERELGLEPQLLPHILHTLCEELLASGYETGSLMSNVDDSTLASLMAEISDPALQRKVLRLSLAVAQADGLLADGEALVVEAARHHWKLVDGQEPIAAKTARRYAA